MIAEWLFSGVLPGAVSGRSQSTEGVKPAVSALIQGSVSKDAAGIRQHVNEDLGLRNHAVGVHYFDAVTREVDLNVLPRSPLESQIAVDQISRQRLDEFTIVSAGRRVFQGMHFTDELNVVLPELLQGETLLGVLEKNGLPIGV